MGKGNWLNKEREFDRHAGEIDRSIKKNAGKKEVNKDSLEAQLAAEKSKWDLTFEDKYPHFVDWELEFYAKNSTRISFITRELREYYDMNEYPQQAYTWIKSFWQQKVEPRDAWNLHIKPKLGW